MRFLSQFTTFAARYDIAPTPIHGRGPLGIFALDLNILNLFNKVISNIIGILTIAAGLWFIFQFLFGAFAYLTSGGDKAKTTEASQKITSALIGLVIVVAAIFLIDLIGTLLGLDILRPGKFILDLWLGEKVEV